MDGIRRYDVGVDENKYYPVSVKQIIEFFENKRVFLGSLNVNKLIGLEGDIYGT